MPAHLEMLQSASKGVRVAAGENVALMFDCVNVLRKDVSLIHWVGFQQPSRMA